MDQPARHSNESSIATRALTLKPTELQPREASDHSRLGPAAAEIRSSLTELAGRQLEEPIARAHLELALLALARRLDFLYDELGIDGLGESDS